jgi:hypothetical protein
MLTSLAEVFGEFEILVRPEVDMTPTLAPSVILAPAGIWAGCRGRAPAGYLGESPARFDAACAPRSRQTMLPR